MGIDDFGPSLTSAVRTRSVSAFPEFADYTLGEFADNADVLDCTSESLVLWIRGPADRVEDVRVDEDVLVSG
jgi:hypothetical protein